MLKVIPIRVFVFCAWIVVLLITCIALPRFLDLGGWRALLLLAWLLSAPFGFIVFSSWKTIHEAHIVAVERLGQFLRFILVYKGHYYDEKKDKINEIKKTQDDGADDGEKKKFKDRIRGLLGINFHIGGFYRLGWFTDTAMKKEFSWKTPGKGKQSAELKNHDEEKLYEFFVGIKDYADTLESVPDADNIRLDFIYVWTVIIKKPYLALVFTHDYISFMYEAMQDIMRSGMRRTHFAELEEDEIETTLGPNIFNGSEDRRVKREKLYGFELKEFSIKDIDPSEEDVIAMLRQAVENKQKAKAMKELAKGQAEKDKIEAEGKFNAAEFEAKMIELLAKAGQEKRVAETGGAIAGAVKKVREEVGDKKLTTELLTKIVGAVEQSMSVDGKALQHIKLDGFGGSGGQGGGDIITNIAAQYGIGKGLAEKIIAAVGNASTMKEKLSQKPEESIVSKIEAGNKKEEEKPKTPLLSREEDEERLKKLFQAEEKQKK